MDKTQYDKAILSVESILFQLYSLYTQASTAKDVRAMKVVMKDIKTCEAELHRLQSQRKVAK